MTDSVTPARTLGYPERPGRPLPRVTLVAGTWPPMRCGIAPYSRNLTNELKQKGVAVQVVSDVRGERPGSVPSWRLAHWSLTEVLTVIRALRSTPPHIIHLQHPTRATRFKPAVYVLPMLLRLLLPKHAVVTTFHYLRPIDRRTAALRLFFLVPAAFSHALVLTTEREATYARRLFSRKRLLVAPAGLTEPIERPSSERRAQTRRDLGFDRNDYVVVYFGYVLPGKGIDTLLHGLPRLPEHAKFLVVGGSYDGHDGYLRDLQALAERLGLGRRVTWAGRVQDADLGRVLSAGDCAALPFEEGASLKRSTLLACLAAGLPVVSTVGPEVEQAMVDHENLLLVPPRDPAALQTALSSLMDHPDLGRHLARSTANILDVVSWQRIADLHLCLYQRLQHERRLP